MTVVDAHGGTIARSELEQWLKPRWDGLTDATRDRNDRGLVNQALQAASGLGLIETSRDTVELAVPSLPVDISGFADLVHSLLLAQADQSSDADILDAFACAVVETELRANRQWLSDRTAAQIADLFTRSLKPRAIETADQRYNTSRHATWMRWVEFVGLNQSIAPRTTLLSVTDRLHRALRASDLPRDEAIVPDAMLAWVASTLPYLDKGTLFLAAAKRMGHVPGTSISRLLSAALRDLHEDGVIRLVAPRGDAQVVAKLASDTFADIHAFNAVILNGSALDA
ncbi:hypothetical protein OMP43_09285 [Sphingomonas sp. CBMAI 2297]|uniref:hypothetical protein n=1 Tax=Sphingomonas sp. CBMAI 2297 TaxID=2991720 RepID=UPI002457528C|nr:hypothetical protein [Sphingomonas sp. CBMAI 2297]MDH4744207.1 hypothetical protein [Sphingomonas sp. CBMAI 2297]